MTLLKHIFSGDHVFMKCKTINTGEFPSSGNVTSLVIYLGVISSILDECANGIFEIAYVDMLEITEHGVYNNIYHSIHLAVEHIGRE